MIAYLVSREHDYTMQSFLVGYGAALARQFTIIDYEQLFAKQSMARFECVIFSDLDRLHPTMRVQLGRLHDFLRSEYPATRILNHPQQSMLRYDLLRSLYRRGINRFDVCRVRDREMPTRFPVVYRFEAGSETGALPLLQTAAEVEALFERSDTAQPGAPVGLDERLLVEFCDTADAQGIYRKYGAFIVGERIVPRHVFFSRQWMVKLADLADPALLDEERAYIEANPHAAQLLDICRQAGIGYGRIDYSLLEGRVQVWEINTNPMLTSHLGEQIPARQVIHRRFAELMAIALAGVDGREAT